MTKDKALEELFLAQKPHFDDHADFMASLTKRLDAVEYIRKYEEATLRRYKLALAVALVVGFISGGVTIAFVLSMPTDDPLFTFHAQTGFLLWLSENSRPIATTALSLLISIGLISIIGNVRDIMNMCGRGSLIEPKTHWFSVLSL